MAVPTCTLWNGDNSASLDINDGTIYTILPGIDMGVTVTTWDEYKSYAGGVAQVNVSDANIIDVTIPLRVEKDSRANLRAAIAAINTKIASITQGVTHLVYDGTTYHLMASQRVGWVEDEAFGVAFRAFIILALKRNNVVA